MTHAFDLPHGRVFEFDEVDIRLEAGNHPYELRNAQAIAANWEREAAANPALFNGRMVLFSALSLGGRRLAGRCHLIDYATLLYWRRYPSEDAQHCFAHAMPVSSDGVLLAVRMGAHTANPRRVYFAAGSFEPADIRGDVLDVEANMVREVSEETGLELGSARAEPGWRGWSSDGRTVIFRRYRFAETAEVLAERVRRHVAAETEPEIDGPVLLWRASDLPAETVPHMPPMLEWHFSEGT